MCTRVLSTPWMYQHPWHRLAASRTRPAERVGYPTLPYPSPAVRERACPAQLVCEQKSHGATLHCSWSAGGRAGQRSAGIAPPSASEHATVRLRTPTPHATGQAPHAPTCAGGRQQGLAPTSAVFSAGGLRRTLLSTGALRVEFVCRMMSS